MVAVSPSQVWREALRSLHIWKRGSIRAVQKPLLSLLFIARAAAGAENTLRFRELDAPLTSLLQEFGPPRKAHHPEYPFWHLQTDGFWEIEGATVLPKMKDGNPSRGTLLQKDAAARIPEDLWRALVSNPELRTELAQNLLHSFWPESLHEAIKPKAPFRPVFQVATTREGSGVALVHDPDAEPQTADQPPPGGQEADGVSCSWWRRGRVELHLEHGLRVLMAA